MKLYNNLQKYKFLKVSMKVCQFPFDLNTPVKHYQEYALKNKNKLMKSVNVSHEVYELGDILWAYLNFIDEFWIFRPMKWVWI